MQDVDRTRVLTASAVMEKPVAVLGSEQGPRSAHKLMREHQTTALMVVDRGRVLKGIVHEHEVAEAVTAGIDTIASLVRPATVVQSDTVLAELLGAAVESPALAVVGADGRLQGVVPRVTLLSALAEPTTEVHHTDPETEVLA